MASGVRPAPGRRDWPLGGYEVPALVVLLALGWVTIVSIVQPESVLLTQSGVLSAAISTAFFLIALGACYVALTEFLLYGWLSSLCIALAFLAFGGGSLGLRMLPLLTGHFLHLNWDPYGRAILDVVAGAFLVFAGAAGDRAESLGRRRGTVVAGLAAISLLVLAVALWVYAAGDSRVPASAARFAPLPGALLFFAASVLFWRSSKLLNRVWFFWLSLSVALAGFAQFQYAIHQYPLDSVQPGDVLRLVFFTGILLALASEWSQDYRGLRWQAQELAALHSLAVIPEMHDVSTVVHHIAAIAGDAVRARARVILAESDGRAGDADPLEQVDASSNGHRGRDDKQMYRQWVGEAFEQHGDGQILVGVPLRTAERPLGILMAGRDADNDFSSYDLRLLGALGAQASILLERSLLYDEIAAGAVLQERARLAREIHDGLAQHLAFLKMRVAWLKRSGAGPREFEDIERVLETALIEARHAITTLRSSPDTGSVVEAIARYAEEFGQVSGLNVDVQSGDRAPDLGPKVRVELLRVVQEALNNVRKHARATNIWVQVAALDGGVDVSIRDNGSGFAATQDFEGHFGLEIMGERAESVGGRLTITSTLGEGTEVRIWVPGRELERELSQANRSGLGER